MTSQKIRHGARAVAIARERPAATALQAAAFATAGALILVLLSALL